MSKINYHAWESYGTINVYPSNLNLPDTIIARRVKDDHRYLINPYSVKGIGAWLSKINDPFKVERILKSMYGTPIVSSNITEEWTALHEFSYYWQTYRLSYPTNSWLRHGEDHLANISKLIFWGAPKNNPNDGIVGGRGWITNLAANFKYSLPELSGVTLTADNTTDVRITNGQTFVHLNGEDIYARGRSYFSFRYRDYSRLTKYSEGPRSSMLPYKYSNTTKHLVIEEHDGRNVIARAAADDAAQDTLSVVRVEGNNNRLLLEFKRSFTVKVETTGLDKNTTMVYVDGMNNVITILIREPIHFDNSNDNRNYGWIALNGHSSNKIIIYNEHNFTTNQRRGLIGNAWEPIIVSGSHTFKENGGEPNVKYFFLPTASYGNIGIFADKDITLQSVQIT